MRKGLKRLISGYLFYILEENEKIVFISLKKPNEDFLEEESPVLRQCVLELEEYFLKKRKSFSFPYKLHGSPFQKAVYQKAIEIPYGSVLSYKELAMKVGSPKAYRAVGKAMAKNPLLLLVPCHRVVSKDGLGGFAFGLKMKEELLKIENFSFK